MFKIGDIVMFDHPLYPELRGLATITDIINKVAYIEFCDGKGEFKAHLGYLQKFTS